MWVCIYQLDYLLALPVRWVLRRPRLCGFVPQQDAAAISFGVSWTMSRVAPLARQLSIMSHPQVDESLGDGLLSVYRTWAICDQI